MRSDGLYVLDQNGEPVAEPDPQVWADWFFQSKIKEPKLSIVRRSKIGKAIVSTVFIGVDHNFSEDGPPILWESMVFGGPFDHQSTRCSGSREQAEAMHERMIQLVKEATEQ